MGHPYSFLSHVPLSQRAALTSFQRSANAPDACAAQKIAFLLDQKKAKVLIMTYFADNDAKC